MKEVQYTNIPEISDFFEIGINESGEFVSAANSSYNTTVKDLERIANLVSKRWSLCQDFGDDDIRRILEVLYGTLGELQYMRDNIIRKMYEQIKED